MNLEIINSIYKYIEVLYENNQRLIKIFGIDAIDAIKDGSKDILNLIQDIPRLIPYSYSEKKKKLVLSKNDGLLENKKAIPDLKDSYQIILDKNGKCLEKTKKIRNKYEHILHNVRSQSCFKGNDSWFEYGFNVENRTYHIESSELIHLFKDLNELYNKLIKQILKYIYENKLNDTYGYLARIDLLGFNKIYDSNLLHEIGKAITGI